jgi:hypothetical protein
MVLRMQVAAKRLGLPVFVWPLAIASSNPTNINMEFLNAMPESQKMNYPKLFGYGFAGMKVRINHNASLDANVVNGTLGTITHIAPSNTEEILRQLAQRQWEPGDLLFIEKPLAVMLCCPTATTQFATEIVLDMNPKASNHMKRKNIVKVNSGIHGSRGAASIRNLEVIDPGYDPDYTGTGYSVQGSTLPLLINDLNHHKNKQ